MSYKKNIVEKLSSVLQNSSSVSLVMFPNHWNVGDSAIWSGIIETLKEMDIRINYVCSDDTYSKEALEKYNPDGPILICGGGNFGDIYQGENNLRMAIFRDFPERHIIQLPQSIWFSCESAGNQMKKVISGLDNFTLFVREYDSLKRAKDILGIDAILCEDMAFALAGGLPRFKKSKSTVRIRVLKREDGESREPLTLDVKSNDPILISDWSQETFQYMRKNWTLRGRFAFWIVSRQCSNYRVPNNLFIWATGRLARDRTIAGIKLLHEGDTLITDRLHAGILSALTKQNVFMIDNSYHKNLSVYKAWLTTMPNIKISKSFAEAYEETIQ